MTSIRLAIIIILVILLTMFTLQNTEVVAVQFLTFEVSMSRAILILLTAIIGFVVGYTTALITRRSRHTSRRRQD